MSDNKLFSLLRSLQGVEKRELHHFLASPFFNQRADVLSLWHFLLEKDSEGLTDIRKETLFAAIYPNKSFDEQQLRYLFTFLREKIEWFLAYRELDQSPALSDLALAKTYRKKGLEKHFRQAIRRTDKTISKMPDGLEKKQVMFFLDFEKYFFSEQQKRVRESHLQAVHDSFDRYIIIGKLRLACHMAAHQAVVKTNYDNSFLPFLLNWLKDHPLLKEPIICIYYHCYWALTNNEESHFLLFRQQLATGVQEFDPKEARELLLMAINFCIRQVNAGKQHFITTAFDLYKLGLQNKLLLENGQLTRFTYKNIVALGLGLKAYDWVRAFIEEWQPFLEDRFRESMHCFNLAKLHFTQKNYAAAMPLLAQVDDADFLLMLDAKVLLLKMYFEQKEWDALDSLLASFRTFLRRKKQIGYHKEHYKSLLRYTSKLLKMNVFSKDKRVKLRQEIMQNETVLEKQWLLEQLKN